MIFLHQKQQSWSIWWKLVMRETEDRFIYLRFFDLFFFCYLQENLELYLHLYPSRYLLHCTAFYLALLVCVHSLEWTLPYIVHVLLCTDCCKLLLSKATHPNQRYFYKWDNPQKLCRVLHSLNFFEYGFDDLWYNSSTTYIIGEYSLYFPRDSYSYIKNCGIIAGVHQQARLNNYRLLQTKPYSKDMKD